MDVGMLKAVSDWPVPQTIKELQHFLGFAHFYRQFIQGFSTVAVPMTSLLRNEAKRLKWNEQAQAALRNLRNLSSHSTSS